MQGESVNSMLFLFLFSFPFSSCSVVYFVDLVRGDVQARENRLRRDEEVRRDGHFREVADVMK